MQPPSDRELEDFTFAGSHAEVSSTSWEGAGLPAPLSNASHMADLSRDELQDGHLKDRVCLTQVSMNHDTDGDALQPVTTGLPEYLGQPQDSSMASCTPVGLAAAPSGGATYGAFSNEGLDMPSLGDHTLDLKDVSSTSDEGLPQYVLDEIDKLFPDLPMVADDSPKGVAVAESTQFDIMLAQQPGSDLLQGVMEDSGLFPELDGYLDSNTDHLQIPEQFSPETEAIKDDVIASWLVSPTPSSGIAPQQLSGNFAPILATPSPSVFGSSVPDSGVSLTPRAPTKRPAASRLRLSVTPTPEPSASPSTSTGRPRRSSRKPLRFEETVSHDDDPSMDYTPEEVEASTSTTAGRKRQRLSATATEQMTAAEKYHRNRVLNNEASKRCRQKKKTKTKELAEEEEDLVRDNRKLKAEYQELLRKKEKMNKLLNLLFQLKMGNART